VPPDFGNVSEHPDPSPEVVDRLRAICLGLPEVAEEEAWTGTRWAVEKKMFAHVLTVADGWPPVVARAWGSDGPVTLLTFRAAGDELDALRHVGHPFRVARWGRDVVLMAIDDGTDWDEVRELLTESYCLMAPQKLAAQVERPAAD
jgi:predicted DNA-binding protein (MmcQ/YjbR family)